MCVLVMSVYGSEDEFIHIRPAMSYLDMKWRY